MNERRISVKTLLNASAYTQATTGSNVDLGGSASVGKREMKVIVVSSGGTYATATLASWPIVLEECDTTNGTFSTIAGDSVTSISGTPSTVATVSTYNVKPAKRYVRGRVDTVGTGATSCNIAVLMLNEERQA